MADIAQTPANVRASATATTVRGTAGESIAPGDSVYVNASTQVMKADADAQATADGRGIAISYASAGDQVFYVSKGPMNPGGTVVIGETYVVSANVGKIAPITDLVSGKWVCILGVGKSATTIDVRILSSGTQKP